MSKKATIIAVVNQKGGTGKTTTTENLGVGLALEGKKVLLVDTDPQASLTVSLGNPCPDDLSPTLSDLMGKIMMENLLLPMKGFFIIRRALIWCRQHRTLRYGGSTGQCHEPGNHSPAIPGYSQTEL